MLDLNSLLLSSEDPDKLSSFYAEVLQEGPSWQEGGYTGFKAGSCYLMIGPHSKVHGSSQNPERLLFNFETADVATEFDRLKSIEGASVVQEPYAPGESPDMTLATLADPDGNFFQLASPMP